MNHPGLALEVSRAHQCLPRRHCPPFHHRQKDIRLALRASPSPPIRHNRDPHLSPTCQAQLLRLVCLVRHIHSTAIRTRPFQDRINTGLILLHQLDRHRTQAQIVSLTRHQFLQAMIDHWDFWVALHHPVQDQSQVLNLL